jgi:hypothetical protein
MRDYLYVDFENFVSRKVNLRKMTLRQYLGAAPTIGIGYACNDGAPQWVDADDNGTLPVEVVEMLVDAANDPNVTWVGHNFASYDARVLRRQHGVPQMQSIDDTLELAMCAFPNQAGGYKLKKLAETLGLTQPKIDIDLIAECRTWPLTRASRQRIAEYCMRDTALAREIHRLCLPRIPGREREIAELCNAVRELHFIVRAEKVEAALEKFSAVAASSVADAMSIFDDGFEGDEKKKAETRGAFGWVREPGTLDEDDPGLPRSVKPEKLKAMLLDRLGFDTRTISYKKNNPTNLAANPEAATALQGTSRANKALSHKRRVGVFTNGTEVDAELGFFRAHTGRFSSPSTGRGLNLHNLPKRDKAVAQPLREMCELPPGLCLVRADEANVEYRVEGWMTHCAHTDRLFSQTLLADPYSEFGFAATGVLCSKDDPARQLYKAAVLGLGFMMGIGTWMSQLALLISDPANGVTLEDLEGVCAAQQWAPVTDQWALAQATKINAPLAVLTAAFYMRQKFHEIHPEFATFGKWLMLVANNVSSAIDPERAIDAAYALPNAPDRSRLDLYVDRGLSGRTLRARCGPWSETVAWRDLGLHDTKFGFCLSSIQAGNKGYRKITPNILIENVVQSCARNSICAAKLELKRRGWHYLLSVHDELMIVCSRDRATVLKARSDLLDVLGPGNALGWDWAAVVNPDEINVSQSLFEKDMGELLPAIGTKLVRGKEKLVYPKASEWWGRLEAGEDSLLDVLS